VEELQASVEECVYQEWCRCFGRENFRLPEGAQFTSRVLYQVCLFLFFLKRIFFFSFFLFLRKLIVICRKKADALFIRHNAVISFLNETAQKTTEALSETREMVREELLSHRDHIIHAAMEKGARIHSSPLFALWEEQTIEIEMVQSLYFLLIDDRHQAIPEAHRQTFR
jgi:hypothetical protein